MAPSAWIWRADVGIASETWRVLISSHISLLIESRMPRARERAWRTQETSESGFIASEVRKYRTSSPARSIAPTSGAQKSSSPASSSRWRVTSMSRDTAMPRST